MDKMKLHLVIDFSYLYYKYLFQLKSGRLPGDLTCCIEDEGGKHEVNISKVYYPIREVEQIRKTLEEKADVTLSVCCDRKSSRKEHGKEEGATEAEKKYKSNRGGILVDSDYDNIRLIEDILRSVGYNVYAVAGAEADDIVFNLVDKYKDNFDYTVIYTPDSDVLVNIGPKVGVRRYITGKGYDNVDICNVVEYLSGKFKCNVPYNGVMLYKSTVGDTSDKISGVKKFGPKAFEKLVSWLSHNFIIDWESCGNPDVMEQVIKDCEEYFDTEQLRQLRESFEMVKPLKIEGLQEPTNKATDESRKEVYMKFDMRSLV